ncbi:hypothetical protein HPB50_018435 [Hyalomma asiaticum]|uniref:Uncharacterized protein n=1 Tax=Hyalomma asiaticum TaxID=266040 RepID=A0ACB7S3N1_HYAAI|nr:hypothetical protein HPB50_018435 [Hyalomma asiaticum]
MHDQCLLGLVISVCLLGSPWLLPVLVPCPLLAFQPLRPSPLAYTDPIGIGFAIAQFLLVTFGRFLLLFFKCLDLGLILFLCAAFLSRGAGHHLPSAVRTPITVVEPGGWGCDDSESEHDLLCRKTRKDIVIVHWASFLDHNQRVLLFTQDERVWREAQRFVDGEQSCLELFVSLHGAAISLVNESLVELAYLSACSAPAQWEVCIHDAWKPLTLELATWLEYRWSCHSRVAELKDYVQLRVGVGTFFGDSLKPGCCGTMTAVWDKPVKLAPSEVCSSGPKHRNHHAV